MSGMRLVTERVQKKNIEVVQLGQRSLGNLAVIGQVGRSAGAKAIDFGFAMDDGDRFESGAEKHQGPVDGLQFHQGQSAEFIVGVEDVTEHGTDVLRGLWTSVKRKFVGL